MTGILEKFQKVQIRNENRLLPEDQEFCELQQDLYDKVREHYLRMFADMDNLYKQELAFWNELNASKENASKEVYYKEFMKTGMETQREIILSTHKHFIKNIIAYFNRKYGMQMAESSWHKYIHLEKPQEPAFPDNFFSMTPEEKKQYKEKKENYENQLTEYTMHLIHSRLIYGEIIDDIFAYLGGFSFQEKVEQEIKEAVHNGLKYKQYSVQSKKISFQGFTHSCLDYQKKYEISLGTDDYLGILKALTYYDSKKTTIYSDWRNRFTTFSSIRKKEDTGIYAEHEAFGNKILKFKYFKNGRWDVVFDTGMHALEFAREYLDYGKAA